MPGQRGFVPITSPYRAVVRFRPSKYKTMLELGVLIIMTQHYPPEVGATGQLATELAEDLVGQGVEVTVFAGRPSIREEGASMFSQRGMPGAA